jgi:tRNA-binding protein
MTAAAKATISWEAFEAVELRVGTVLRVEPNPKAKKPAYILQIDFGPYGVKTSSAQLTQNYSAADLVGTQVVGVLNFEPKRIAGVLSEVLVVGALSADQGVVLLRPTHPVENGAPLG